MIRFSLTLFILLLTSVTGFAQVTTGGTTSGPGPPTVTPGAPRNLLAGVRTWGYNIQKPDIDAIAASPYDLVVIDYSKTGEDEDAFSVEDVKRMRAKPDGSRRIVLAYLSIGEAESYRFYWNHDWAEPIRIVEGGEEPEEKDASAAKKGAPKKAAAPLKTRTLHIPRLSAPVWLGRENDVWGTNFLVRYWEKSWQELIFGSPSSYLDRIIATGFDGVFLDRVDAFTGVTDERATGKAEMVQFVTTLARYARQKRPGFAIVPQNGEELLAEPAYLAAIDGIAKEDLLYGHAEEGKPNKPDYIQVASDRLSLATRANLPVLVVEYTLVKETADKLAAEITGKGFIPHFSIKSLDRLVLPDELKPAAALATPKASAQAPVNRGPPQRKGKGKR